MSITAHHGALAASACPTDARAAAATKIVRIIIFNLHAGVSNNTEEAVAISIYRVVPVFLRLRSEPRTGDAIF
jgi:hypothetical protein